jgi:hypothetical protein
VPQYLIDQHSLFIRIAQTSLFDLLVLAVLLENKYLETASKTCSENRVYSMDAGARASRSVQQQFWALALHEIQCYASGSKDVMDS